MHALTIKNRITTISVPQTRTIKLGGSPLL